MSMVMVTVPPVGPPVVVPIGRAIFHNPFPSNKSISSASKQGFQNDPIEHVQAPKIVLDERFDVPQNSFFLDINEGMDDERRIFTNGTIFYKYIRWFDLKNSFLFNNYYFEVNIRSFK